MNPLLLASVTASAVLAMIFVWLNTWALRAQLEETFVSLALFDGLITVGLNALFVGLAVRQRSV
jgi:hypothetical protein